MIWLVRFDGNESYSDLTDHAFYGFYEDVFEILSTGHKLPTVNVNEGPGLVVPTFPYFDPNMLAVRHDAPESIQLMLSKNCLYFQASGKLDYRILIPRIQYDAFDYDYSDFDYFQDSSNVMIVRLFVLKKIRLGDAPIFRLTGSRGVSSDIFVSDLFRKTYESKNCTGLRFKKAEVR